jgi:hypothetical protein
MPLKWNTRTFWYAYFRGILGRLDSNQRMVESKSTALPLGYAPMYRALTTAPYQGGMRDIVSTTAND